LGLTREEVLHIARLARVGLSEEDVARFQEQLSEILDHFDVLRQVDTESVPATSHTLDLENVTSPDQVRDSFPRKEILGNAPSVSRQSWPRWDEALTAEELVEVVFQINGKIKARESLPAGTTEAELRAKADTANRTTTATTRGTKIDRVSTAIYPK
jgi:aspartyl-tRNA(Asn)/glutamyl-tRNA(Gln) amidotransferase subunit C